MRLYFSAILLVVILGVSKSSFAQTWELGGFAGTAGYMGDLNPNNPLKVGNLAFGGHAKRNFDGYWALKLNVAYGKIEAADAESGNAYYRSRNLNFFSPLTEVSLQTEFNFFNYIPSISRRIYSPYLYVGVGFVTFNPKTVYDGKTYQLSTMGTEGQKKGNSYRTLALSVPFGAGVKYNFSGKWSLGAELGYRTAYTDYLDDVSQNYVPATLAADPTDAEIRQALADPSDIPHTHGTQRGDYRKNDTYLFLGFTISFTFFNDKCPVVDE